MSAALYAEWKRGLLVESLARARVAATVGPLVDTPGEGRRRATFHSRIVDGGEVLGFMRARAHEIIAIEACPLFAPGLTGAIAAARALAADLRGAGKPLDIQATATLGGLDFDLRGAGPLDAPMRRKLVATADRLDLARVASHGEVIIERRAPQIAFGDVLAVLPPGGFLQATVAGERALATGAAAALGGARPIADLFCGAGAFALRLARDHEIAAVDSDAAAIAALKRAAGAASGLHAIATETRDLFRRPLDWRRTRQHSRPCFSIRRAPGRRRSRARSPPMGRRSSAPSPAMARASPATRVS